MFLCSNFHLFLRKGPNGSLLFFAKRGKIKVKIPILKHLKFLQIDYFLAWLMIKKHTKLK